MIRVCSSLEKTSSGSNCLSLGKHSPCANAICWPLLAAQIRLKRQEHQKRLEQIKSLEPAIDQMCKQTAAEFATAHEGEGDEAAAATRLALNAALLVRAGIAHDAAGGTSAMAGKEATLDSLSLQYRHNMLTSKSNEEVFAELAARDAERQQRMEDPALEA